MKNILAIAIAFAASTSFAMSLTGTVNLVDAGNTSIVDSGTFMAIPGGVDVYEVTVENPNNAIVSAVGLNLPNPNGDYLNGATLAVQGSGLPVFGPFTTADSTFNAPVPVGDLLGAGLLQDGSNFIINYSIAGGGQFIAPNSSAVLATLVVPAGSTLDTSGFGGNVEYELVNNVPTFPAQLIEFGSTDPVIPEPSTALLAGLALVGFVARRK